MKILQIIPGSGGNFYCGNCLRDSKYVDALRAQGHEVIKIPMYLPLFSDEHDITDIPVFYGAVSIYLKQVYPVFRNAPAWFDKILNSRPVLKLAAGFAGSTRAKGLEEMTVSMLLGEEGQQKHELDRMIDWIAEHCNPDIIHISNALLLGLAHKLREKIRVPLICSLQDEDTWIDVMKPVFKEKVWKLMENKATDVDAFISVSNYYRQVMKKNMNIPEDKLFTAYIGVDPKDYTYIPVTEKKRTIGFISRMCYDNGLDILTDAFIELRRSKAFDDVELVITGGSTGDDTDYIKNIRKKLKKNYLLEFVEFQEDFVGERRKQFFNKVSVVSVPVRNGEAFGIYLLESMASGVPVIQPALGAFPEILQKAGGGVLYRPNSSDQLAKTLAGLLSNPDLLKKLSFEGRQGVENYFDITQHSREMFDIYSLISNKNKPANYVGEAK